MIYLDTSALVKLVFEEDESAALGEWLSSRVDVPKISSDLSIIELLRACRRADPRVAPVARRLLEGIDLLPIDRAIAERAADVSPTHLRSLDAIHLASALSLQSDLTVLVSYDDRLCTAATGAGIEVASPT
jgi:predicted nucleic acid-binding protein